MGIIKRFDHVAIGVEDINKATHLIRDILGGEPMKDRGDSDKEGFAWATFKLGGKKIELVSPHKSGEGGIGKYIAKYGEGFHHLTLGVTNLEEAMEYFESRGIRILATNKDDPNFEHFFLNPKDTFGALIQVFEENEVTLGNAE